MNEFRWSSLHLITKLIVFAVVLHLAGDVLAALRDFGKLQTGAATLDDWLISVAHAFGYSLVLIGSAAMVELLFRIWREIRMLRTGGVTVTERPAADAPES